MDSPKSPQKHEWAKLFKLLIILLKAKIHQFLYWVLAFLIACFLYLFWMVIYHTWRVIHSQADLVFPFAGLGPAKPDFILPELAGNVRDDLAHIQPLPCAEITPAKGKRGRCNSAADTGHRGGFSIQDADINRLLINTGPLMHLVDANGLVMYSVTWQVTLSLLVLSTGTELTWALQPGLVPV